MDEKATTHINGRKLTAELVARVERFEPDPGPEPGTTEHTDAEFDAMVETLLLEYSPQELWVFAYGSLIWNPEFDFFILLLAQDRREIRAPHQEQNPELTLPSPRSPSRSPQSPV